MFSSYSEDDKWSMFDHMAVIVTNANSATYDAIESAVLGGCAAPRLFSKGVSVCPTSF